MAVANNRNDFKELILRRLGKGVIRIELSDAQLDDQIDYALDKFADYHFDGSADTYYKYQITADNVTNGWIPIPDDTIGVVEIFDLVSTLMGVGMWNVQYQFVLGNMPSWGNIDMTNYWMTMSNLQFMQQILVGKQPLRYNRYINQLFIDMDWTRVNVGDFLVVKLYQRLNPDTYTAIWADQWLINYTTELAKKQWGTNLKKYTTMTLPSGQSFSGQQIYDEAVTAIEKLEDTLINSFSLPVTDLIG